MIRTTVAAVWHHRWFGLVTTFLVGIVGTVVVFVIPAQYEAAARVYVDTQSILKPLMSGLAVQPNVEQQLAIMSRTLISRPNVERVIKMTELKNRTTTSHEHERLVDDLVKRIEFKPIQGATNMYSITYRDIVPETANTVVQSLLRIFVESNQGDKRRDTDQAQKFIDEQIKIYDEKLRTAENALKDFKLRNMAVMPNLAPDYANRFNDLQAQLVGARLELRQVETAREEIRKQLALEPQMISSLEPPLPFTEPAAPASGASPATPPPGARRTELDDRIEAQRKRLDELRIRFTEDHPDVVSVRRILTQLEGQREVEVRAELARREAEMKAEAARRALQAANAPKTSATAPPGSVVNPVYQQLRVAIVELEAQVASSRARVQDFEARVAEARELSRAVPKVEAEYSQLNRDYEVHKKNYEQLIGRREAAQISGDLENSAGIGEFRVIDPPRVGQWAVSPNRPLLLAAVFVLSILAGIAAAFLKEQVRPTFLDLRSLRLSVNVPTLGVVSLVPSASGQRFPMAGRLAFGASGIAYICLFGATALFIWLQQLPK